MASNSSDTEDCTNILLLGEEDVKHRFLNSLANYVEYRKVEELSKYGLKCLIPQKITYRTSDGVNCLNIKQSKGIFSSPGATYEDVASYIVYGRNNKKCCVIDLQGANNENGIKTLFAQYTYLHSILIVLEEDISKAVEHVDFVKRNFDNSVLENISYIFTQVEQLDQYVKDLNKELISRNIPIVSGCQNVYCMDAAMFSDLAKNMSMTGDKETIWDWSRKNCFELLSYIQQLQPCTIKKDLPSRDTVLELLQVLAEISVVLQINLVTVKCTLKVLWEGDGRIGSRTISLDCLEYATPTGGTALICKSNNCSSKNIGGSDRKTGYRVCHTPCNCNESCKEIVANYCRICPCKRSEHAKVQYLRKQYTQVICADGKCGIREKLQDLWTVLEEEKQVVLKSLALFHLVGQKGQVDSDYYISFIGQELKRINIVDDAVYDHLKTLYTAIFSGVQKNWPDNLRDVSECIKALYNLEHTGQMLRKVVSTSNHEAKQKMQKTTSTSPKAADLPQVHACSSQNEQFSAKSYSKAVQEKVVPSKEPKKDEDPDEDRFFDCDDGASIINDIAICHAKIAEFEEKLSLQNENIRSDIFYIKGYLKQNRGGSADQLLKMFEEIESSIC